VTALNLISAAMALTGPLQVAPKLQALIVGGGPDLSHNQMGIESNVLYVERLLPPAVPRRILFADGDSTASTVLYTDDSNKEFHRPPRMAKIDGPARLANVQAEIADLGKNLQSKPGTTALLYFTGHGSPDNGEYANNNFDLWSNDELTTRDLAAAIAPISKKNPIVLVMVECFSGSFANLILDSGNPNGDAVDRPICGFFASIPIRMSAGCTPTTNEAEYKDFTGYFFAALTGTSRLGKPIAGADYNKDGKVGMNEAYAYTLINDDSIDTPNCTSDAFLRRYVTTEDKDVFSHSYTETLGWATPAQRAVLEALSADLQLDSEDRLAKAYDTLTRANVASDDDKIVRLIRFVRTAKSAILAHELAKTGGPIQKRFKALIQAEMANPFRA